MWSEVLNASTLNSGYKASINGAQLTGWDVVPTGKAGSTPVYGYTYLRYNGKFWDIRRSGGAMLDANYNLNNANALYPYNVVLDVGAATSFKLEYSTPTYAATSGTITIWGR